MTTNPEEEQNYVTLLMADGLRRRNVGSVAAPTGPVHDRSTIPTQNVVNYAPTRENQLKWHTLNNVAQTMVIRLALSDSQDKDSEEDSGEDVKNYGNYIDLCVLKHGANGVLEVSPDFTNNRKPYTIELEHKKETLEYWIEHVSPVMDYDEQLRESVMQNEVFARHIQVLRQEVGDDFEKPPGRYFRLMVQGEIVSAQDFHQTHGSSLFVHYFLELPIGWSLADQDSGEDHGLTQTCYIRGDNEVAHFGHPFCLDLYFDTSRLDKNSDKLPKWPQVYFEVVSLDYWSRSRTEGYGYISIPIHAGSYHDLIVETWRPLLPTTEMRRYFIGGTPELEDLSYCGNINDSKLLSRFGFHTVTSGRIRTRMYVIHQSKALMPSSSAGGGEMATKRFAKWKRSHLMDRLASATLFSSLGAVMEAFRKARERIAQATQGYSSDGKNEENPVV